MLKELKMSFTIVFHFSFSQGPLKSSLILACVPGCSQEVVLQLATRTAPAICGEKDKPSPRFTLNLAPADGTVALSDRTCLAETKQQCT